MAIGFEDRLMKDIVIHVYPMVGGRVARFMEPEDKVIYENRIGAMLGLNLEQLLADAALVDQRWKQAEQGLSALASHFTSAELVYGEDAEGVKGGFLAGSKPGLADFSLAAMLIWMKRGLGEEDERWKEVERWNEGRWAEYLDAFKLYTEVHDHSGSLEGGEAFRSRLREEASRSRTSLSSKFKPESKDAPTPIQPSICPSQTHRTATSDISVAPHDHPDSGLTPFIIHLTVTAALHRLLRAFFSLFFLLGNAKVLFLAQTNRNFGIRIDDVFKVFSGSVESLLKLVFTQPTPQSLTLELEAMDFIRAHICCCLGRSQSPSPSTRQYAHEHEIPNETTLLIPAEGDVEGGYGAAGGVGGISYEEQRRLERRLGGIVRSKESKMVRIGYTHPFNLHNKDPIGSETTISRSNSNSGSSFVHHHNAYAGSSSEHVHHSSSQHPATYAQAVSGTQQRYIQQQPYPHPAPYPHVHTYDPSPLSPHSRSASRDPEDDSRPNVPYPDQQEMYYDETGSVVGHGDQGRGVPVLDVRLVTRRLKDGEGEEEREGRGEGSKGGVDARGRKRERVGAGKQKAPAAPVPAHLSDAEPEGEEMKTPTAENPVQSGRSGGDAEGSKEASAGAKPVEPE
ncbi:hypothetical protein NMY22_g16462 [Coprinellus aureogranulatus]|nr:hypothetical protein NMY22_g16462 [Coprinellus aureogranulatus]